MAQQTGERPRIEIPYPDGSRVAVEDAPLADVEAALETARRRHRLAENSDNRYALSGERATNLETIRRTEAVLARRRAEAQEAA